MIGVATKLQPPSQVRHALAHPSPPHTHLALDADLPAQLETPRVVDRRLDPQHTALLVVHLDGVLLHPVLDPHPFRTHLNVTARLAAEPAVTAPAQESQHVLTRELP